MLVAHAYNLSYVGSRYQEDHGSCQRRGKKFMTLGEWGVGMLSSQ
jgi:hypothetical protein